MKTWKDSQVAVCRYVNAQGPHMPQEWKSFFVETFDLDIDRGNPYRPVMPKTLVTPRTCPTCLGSGMEFKPSPTVMAKP